MESLVTFLSFFLILVFLIVIHELGHFLVCKAFKIEVEEFGVFFPPRLVKLFQWGETEVTLNSIPLGGFVRPKGENDPGVAGGLAAAPAWQRILVMVAGPLMNLLVAVVLYSVLSMTVGMPSKIVTIEEIVPGLPADSAGIKVGDQLVNIAGTRIESSQTAQDVIRANRGKEITIVVQRGAETLDITLTPRVDVSDGKGSIGILMGGPIIKASLLEAPGYGFSLTYEHSVALFSFLGKFVSGQLGSDQGQLLGFVGMYNGYSEIRSLESQNVIPAGAGTMNFIIQITVSLGLLNLLPIPALDGGRILLASVELLTRRRVPTKLENALIGVTFLALIGLMILVNGREIINLMFSAVTATPTP